MNPHQCFRPSTGAKSRRGFTLIELLTVIAIIGILTAILIPVGSRAMQQAQRTADASNVRQIVQAALITANQFNGRLPGTNQTKLDALGKISPDGTLLEGTVTINQFAAALARYGGLNDANLWVSPVDDLALSNPTLTTVVETPIAPLSPIQANFVADGTVLSFMAVSGLTNNRPAGTPVVFTRGLDYSTGEWVAKESVAAGGGNPAITGSVYGEVGGHIGFLGGNVVFYQGINNSLSDVSGTPTSDLRRTLRGSEAIIGSEDAAVTGTGDVPAG